MRQLDTDVDEFIAAIRPAVRQRDAVTLVEIMRRITGDEPSIWHPGIIGFGRYQYKYDSGREGEAGAAGFAPRKAAMVVYLPDGIGAHTEALTHLGPHKPGVGCLYLKSLDDIDLDVLEDIVRTSYETITAGTYGKRAREGGAD